jgi:hypothetical protein
MHMHFIQERKAPRNPLELAYKARTATRPAANRPANPLPIFSAPLAWSGTLEVVVAAGGRLVAPATPEL